MTLQLNLHTVKTRVVWLTIVFSLSSLFVGAALFRFVLTVISDPQLNISNTTLALAAQRFPQSASIQVRLASRLIEAGPIPNERYEEIAQQALLASSQAVHLAPSKYEAWILLSAAREVTGDYAQAEKDLRMAVSLAPARSLLHWRLANLLVREEKIATALPEFRIAIEADPSLLLPTLRLLWQVTKRDFNQVAAVVPQEPKSQLVWAKFLAEQSQAASAIEVFNHLAAAQLLELPERGQLLDALIAAKEFAQANQGWQHLLGRRSASALIWNGGFETVPRKGLSQFDWQFSDSRYARIRLDDEQKHSGSWSLALEYLGVETTRLDTEIKQLILVRPGVHYRLACYAKADSLVTTDGPRIAVTRLDAPTIVAETAVVASGSHDWQLLTTDLLAPAGTSALLVTIKQTPRFSYAAPTRGTVWFDDLTLQER